MSGHTEFVRDCSYVHALTRGFFPAVLISLAMGLIACGGGEGGGGGGNVAPVAGDLSVTTDEDTPVSIALLATDTDPLTFAVAAGPLNGTLACDAAGACTYTPDAHFNGADSFTFSANDGLLDSDAATATITVNPVNDGPRGSVPDRELLRSELPVTVDLAPFFSDVDAGDTLTYSVTANSDSGTVATSLADSVLTLSLGAGSAGKVSITVQARMAPWRSPALPSRWPSPISTPTGSGGTTT